MVEVRVGSVNYVLDNSKQKEKISNKFAKIGYAPLELIEARKEIKVPTLRLQRSVLILKSWKMVKAIDKMVKGDLNSSHSDCEFHLLVAKATGNIVLEGITDYLWQQQRTLRCE